MHNATAAMLATDTSGGIGNNPAAPGQNQAKLSKLGELRRADDASIAIATARGTMS
jgi:hypothetical protein